MRTITEIELVVVMVDHGEGNQLPPLKEKQFASLGATLVEAAGGASLYLEGMKRVFFDGTYTRSDDSQEPDYPFCIWRVYGLSPEQAVKLILDIIEEVTKARPIAYVHALERII